MGSTLRRRQMVGRYYVDILFKQIRGRISRDDHQRLVDEADRKLRATPSMSSGEDEQLALGIGAATEQTGAGVDACNHTSTT